MCVRGRTYHDVKNCIPFNMTSAILHNTSTSWEQVRYGEFARPISQSGASMRKWVWLARLIHKLHKLQSSPCNSKTIMTGRNHMASTHESTRLQRVTKSFTVQYLASVSKEQSLRKNNAYNITWALIVYSVCLSSSDL